LTISEIRIKILSFFHFFDYFLVSFLDLDNQCITMAEEKSVIFEKIQKRYTCFEPTTNLPPPFFLSS